MMVKSSLFSTGLPSKYTSFNLGQRSTP
jgi:hypothetical protein